MTTDEKIKPVADGYWWCQNCKNEIGAYHVTNQELHEDCGHPAEWITPVSAIAQAEEKGRQAGLREAAEIVNKLAENWSKGDFCPDAYDCRDAITRAAEGK
jgi:hypothetical protein